MMKISSQMQRTIDTAQSRWSKGKRRGVFCVGVLMVYCVGSSSWFHPGIRVLDTRLLGITPAYSLRKLLSPHESVRNSNRVKIWREEVNEMCDRASTDQDMEATKEHALKGAFVMKDEEEIPLVERVDEETPKDPSKKVLQCPFVFLDLGSGVGDTVGEFIDTGLVGCTTDETSSVDGFQAPHFDVDSGSLQYRTANGNSLLDKVRKGEENEEFVGWAMERMSRFYGSMGPEDYCVYGVEANPVLTPELERLERHILKLDPKPLRHVHFFTETLMFDNDDQKKKFFLDTTNVEDRFPGSSVFSGHSKILQSVKHDVELMDTYPTTMTLTSLMKSTLSYFATNVDNEEVDKEEVDNTDPDLNQVEKKSRGHLLLHVDIEGSEFHVLNEVKDSGVLCEFALAGNQVDIYIEYHTPDELGRESINAKRWKNEVRPYFRRNCGDNISLYERQRYFMPPAPPKVLTNAVI